MRSWPVQEDDQDHGRQYSQLGEGKAEEPDKNAPDKKAARGQQASEGWQHDAC